jgi:hypothetical protein
MEERKRHSFSLIAGHYQQSFAVTSLRDCYFEPIPSRRRSARQALSGYLPDIYHEWCKPVWNRRNRDEAIWKT